MRPIIRFSLTFIALAAGGCAPVMAQTSVTNASEAPEQPDVMLPSRGNAPIVDDVMTLGTPSPEANAAASNVSPVIARPQPRSGQNPAALAPTSAAAVSGRTVSGRAEILDGNTLQIGGEVIVLEGADAFEIGQTCLDVTGIAWGCGAKARAKLLDLVSGSVVDCVGVKPIAGAITAHCSVEGESLGAAMVREGLAFAAPGTSWFDTQQREAEAANRGAWVGSFDMPWVVRFPG